MTWNRLTKTYKLSNKIPNKTKKTFSILLGKILIELVIDNLLCMIIKMINCIRVILNSRVLVGNNHILKIIIIIIIVIIIIIIALI